MLLSSRTYIHSIVSSIAIILFLLCNTATAKNKVMVTVDITPKAVHVGDIITMDIYINHDPGYSLYLPDSINLAPFDIIDTKIVKLTKERKNFSQATFKMAIYHIGVFTIPNINLLLKKGDERIEVKTQQRNLEVVSLLKPDENALLDTFPPLDIKQSYLKYLIYVWSVTFALILFLILYVIRKRRGEKEDIVIKEKPVKRDPPEKIAAELLQKIFSGGNISKLNDKELCESVAFTIKYYIKEKFDIDSLEMTSYELLLCLNGAGLGKDYLTTLHKLLNTCDMVKFASRALSRDKTKDDVEDLRAFAHMLVQGAA